MFVEVIENASAIVKVEGELQKFVRPALRVVISILIGPLFMLAYIGRTRRLLSR